MARPSELEKMTYAELTEMEARIERLKIEKQNSERAAVRIDQAEHGRSETLPRRSPVGSRQAVADRKTRSEALTAGGRECQTRCERGQYQQGRLAEIECQRVQVRV